MRFIRLIFAMILCAAGGAMMAEIISIPIMRWVISLIVAIISGFFMSLFICKKLRVDD